MPNRKQLIEQIAELKAQNARYQAWLDALGQYGDFDLWFKDVNSRYLFCNDQFATVMGRSKADLEQYGPDELFNSDRAKRIKAMDLKVMEEGVIRRVIPCGTEEKAEMHDEIRFPVKDSDGNILGLGCRAFEVTEKSVAIETLTNAEKLARMGSWRWSVQQNVMISCSEQMADLLQYPHAELFALLPERIERLVHPEDRHLLKPVEERIAGLADGPYAIEYRMLRGDGQYVYVREAAEPFAFQDNKPSEYIGIIQDVSRQKVAELQLKISNEYLEKRAESRRKDLEYLASHDPLTGLLNRKAFIEKVLSSTQKFQTTGGVLILSLNIRGFKQLIKRYGYEASDKIMKEVAHRISLTTSGYAYASRMNGDSFVLALPPLDNPARTVKAMYLHIEKAVRKNMIINSDDICVDLLGGYSLGACTEKALFEAIRNADIAINKARALPDTQLAAHIPGLETDLELLPVS